MDGEMREMTLPSRHRIRNSNPGGLRPSMLPLGHGGSPRSIRQVASQPYYNKSTLRAINQPNKPNKSAPL